MNVRIGLLRELSTKELMLLNCGLEKTLESPLDCKEIQPVHCKGDQSWAFIGRTDIEAETPVLWPLDAKSWLIWEDPDAGRDLGQEEKGTTEDEMVGLHCWLNEHEFEWTLGVGDGHGALACCGSWGHKELDTTEQLNWTELMLQQKLQYFGHLMGRSDSLEKTLMLGRIEVRRRRGRKRMRRLDDITNSMDMSWASFGCWWWTGEVWCASVHGVAKSWTWLRNWTELNNLEAPEASAPGKLIFSCDSL